jgi:serine phosphatase RsbU (regulator of sigma subunit)
MRVNAAMRGFRFLLPLFFLSGLAASLVSGAYAQQQITLGQSIAPLNGPWKFHIGDNPEWAQPGFDDSGWQSYTIDPKHPEMTAVQAIQAKQLPGWQRHGHPGYTGYAWYRIRLQAPPDAGPLALLMPQYVDDAYEVYVNGQKIGSFGHLDRWHLTYVERPKIFSIPATTFGSGHPVALAIRFWNSRYQALPSEDSLDGGLRGLPLLGPSELLQVFRQSMQAQIWKTWWPGWLLSILYGTVGIISLFLFLFSRSQHEYLWAGISLTSIAVLTAFEALAPATNLPIQLSDVVAPIADWIGFFALPLAAMYLLSVPRPIWRRTNYAVMAVIIANDLVHSGLRFGLLPPSVAMDRIQSLLFIAGLLFVALLLLAIAVDGVRTIGRKAWLPLTPGLLCACGLIAQVGTPSAIAVVGIYYYFYLSVPLSVLVIFLMRFTEQQRENVRLVDDMKQAQEVQRVLIPEKLPQVPELVIESEYRPAREVGGDFFQILPDSTDDSVLIVVGDVTGHGLQAGMLVALIVGAIRNETRHTSDPLTVLNALNQALCGRGHAHATCLALRISADGAVTLANAGHLPPYLNGKELPMEGALPLGMVENAEFSVMHFHLAPGDRLLLMSDGIAEAQDEQGHLFGFERISELLKGNMSRAETLNGGPGRKPITAAEVAAAAQAFGQEDDISVLSVTRIETL